MDTARPLAWALTSLSPDGPAVLALGAGPAVITGPAGSGKSTLLVEQIARSLESGAPRDAVVVLAVSRQGVADLSMRIAGRLGVAGMPVSTLPSFAFNIVKNHFQLAGYPNQPRLLGTVQFWEELKRALAREDRARWPRYSGSLDSPSLLALLNDLLSGAANNDLSPEEIERLLAEHGRPDLAELAGFSARHNDRLKRQSLLSLDRAVLEALHLLESNPPLLSSYQQRLRKLLVDQFEDATCVEARLVRLLGGAGLVVAGNPLQATNSYRGGSPAFILQLMADPGVRVVRLPASHRPAMDALQPESRLFPHAGPNHPQLPRPEPDRITSHTFLYRSDESSWIAREIVSLLRSGSSPDQIAVLFRTASDPVARSLAIQLSRAAVPVRSVPTSLFAGADPMVAAAIELLRYLSAAEADRPALFLKLLASPLGGLTRASVRSVRRLARESGVSPRDLAGNSDLLQRLAEEVASGVANLANCLDSIESHAQCSPDDLLWQVWLTFPAFARQATADLAVTGEAHSSPAAYRAFLDEVCRIVEDHAATSLTDVVRLFESGHFHELGVAPARGGSGVTLATIHQSRCGEWAHLFLSNMVEEVYPLRQSPIGNLAPMLLRCGEDEPGDLQERHLDEERRVLYVALSRAVETVCVTWSGVDFDGSTRLQPSRYVTALGLDGETCEVSETSQVYTPDDPVSYYRRQLVHDQTESVGSCHAERGAKHLLVGVETLRSAQGDPHRNHCGRVLDDGDTVARAEALYALGRLSEAGRPGADPSLWWDNLAIATDGAPPYPTGSLHLSASRLSAYRDCPLGFKFGTYLRLDNVSSDAMTLGTLLHGVLEAYHAPGSAHPRTREALEAIVDELYDPAQFSRPPIAAQVRLRITALLDLYFPRYGSADSVAAVETPFRFQLGPHVLNGRIDRIDRRSDGTLELIDYKSGGAMSHGDAETDIQLALYALAFRHVPELASLGTPGRASYLYIRAIGPRADGKRGYAPTEEGQRSLIGKIERYSSGILAELFPSRFRILDTWSDLSPEEMSRALKSDPCRNCAFTWLCPEKERGLEDG